MSRKMAALLVMVLGVSAGVPAAAQLLSPTGTGTGRYMVQYRSGRGWPWRLYTRTRNRARAYMIASQVRASGYQARVVYGSYYASMPYYGYGYGYPRMYGRGYGRRYGYGYGRFNPALTSGNVTGAISALTSGSQHNSLVRRLVPARSPSASATASGAGATSRQVAAAGMTRTPAQHAMVHNVTRHALGTNAGSAGVRSQAAAVRAHTISMGRAVGRPNTAGQHAANVHAAVHMNRAMGGMPRAGLSMGGFRGGGGFHGGGGGFHGGGFHGGGGGHGGGGHR